MDHSLTHARYSGWHEGQQQRYPTPVCSGPELLTGPPGPIVGLELPFYSSTPGVLGSPSLRRPPVVSSEVKCGRCCISATQVAQAQRHNIDIHCVRAQPKLNVRSMVSN